MKRILLLLISIPASSQGVISYSLLRNKDAHCLLFGDFHRGSEKINQINVSHVQLMINLFNEKEPERKLNFFVELPKKVYTYFKETGKLPGEIPDAYLMLLQYWIKREKEDPESRLKFIAADKRSFESAQLWVQLHIISAFLERMRDKNIVNIKKSHFLSIRHEFINSCEKSVRPELEKLTIGAYLRSVDVNLIKMEKWYNQADKSVKHLFRKKMDIYKKKMGKVRVLFKDLDPTLLVGRAVLKNLEKEKTLNEVISAYLKIEELVAHGIDFSLADAGFLRHIFKVLPSNVVVLAGDCHTNRIRCDLKTLGWQEEAYVNLRKEEVSNANFFFQGLKALLYMMSSDTDLTTLESIFRRVMKKQIQNQQKSAVQKISSDDHVKRCYNCEAPEKKLENISLKTCAKCRLAQYCSRECQVSHWKEHKKVCKEP